MEAELYMSIESSIGGLGRMHHAYLLPHQITEHESCLGQRLHATTDWLQGQRGEEEATTITKGHSLHHVSVRKTLILAIEMHRWEEMPVKVSVNNTLLQATGSIFPWHGMEISVTWWASNFDNMDVLPRYNVRIRNEDEDCCQTCKRVGESWRVSRWARAGIMPLTMFGCWQSLRIYWKWFNYLISLGFKFEIQISKLSNHLSRQS